MQPTSCIHVQPLKCTCRSLEIASLLRTCTFFMLLQCYNLRYIPRLPKSIGQNLTAGRMSAQQSHRKQATPLKSGDVFPVSGEISGKHIAPQDAAMMQSAENKVLRKTQKGGPAAIMESAAVNNERAGVVGPTDITDEVAGDEGVKVSSVDRPGGRDVTESIAGQVDKSTLPGLKKDAIILGEALEAAAATAGDKPVDQNDAAAIQAAEIRATHRNEVMAGGIAAAAQSAAAANERLMVDEDKTKLADVLTDAVKKLPKDKPVSREDAGSVVGAELRDNPNLETYTGGVADSVLAAAMINQNK